MSGRPEQKATVSERIVHAAMQCRKSLSMISALASSHLTLSLTAWPIRYPGPIVRTLPGVVERCGQSIARGRPVAAKLAGNQPLRLFVLALSVSCATVLCGVSITTALNEDVDYIAVLINGTPQIVPLTSNLNEHFVDVPGIAEPSFPPLQGPPIAWSKLQTPAANGLVGDFDTALGKQILDIAETQAESVIEPDCVADDLRWKSVTMVAWFAFAHHRSVPDGRST